MRCGGVGDGVLTCSDWSSVLIHPAMAGAATPGWAVGKASVRRSADGASTCRCSSTHGWVCCLSRDAETCH